MRILGSIGKSIRASTDKQTSQILGRGLAYDNRCVFMSHTSFRLLEKSRNEIQVTMAAKKISKHEVKPKPILDLRATKKGGKGEKGR